MVVNGWKLLADVPGAADLGPRITGQAMSLVNLP
jgi:hypothetical protein